MDRWYSGPNRYICSVFEEIRLTLKCEQYINKNLLISLIEEAQVYANRMEATLDDWSDIRRGHEVRKELGEEIKKLEQQKEDLEKKLEQLNGLIRVIEDTQGDK